MREESKPTMRSPKIATRTRNGIEIPLRECVPRTRVKTSPIYSPDVFERLMRAMGA